MSEAPGFEVALPKNLPEVEGLTTQQAYAAFLIASGYTQKEAGEEVGVCRKTICRWHKKPEFMDLIAENEDRQVATRLPKAFRQQFGVPHVSQVRDTSLALLMAAITADPAELEDDEGNRLPLKQVPYYTRIALQDPGSSKHPARFMNKLDAAKELVMMLGLRDPRKREEKLDPVADDIEALLGDRMSGYLKPKAGPKEEE